MATAETGVRLGLSASASMHRITTNGEGLAVTASGDNRPIAAQPGGNVEGQGHPCLALDDLASYFWQALGLASAIAVSPIVIYAFLKATCFLFNHVKLFGWAWILCFLISFFVAIYLENCGAGAGAGVTGLVDNLVQQSIGVAVSYISGCDPPQGNQHSVPHPQGQGSSPKSTRTGAGPNAAVGGLHTQGGVFNTDTQQNSAADLVVGGGQGQGPSSLPSTPKGTRTGSGPNAAIGGLQTQGGVFNTDTQQNSVTGLPVGVGKGQRLSDAYNSSQNSTSAFPDGLGPGSRKELGSLDSSTGGARLVTPAGKVFNRDPTGAEETPLPN